MNPQSWYKKTSGVLVWLFSLILLLAACADPGLECQDALGCVKIRPNDPIRLGYLLAESGDGAFLGLDSRGGIEIAVEGRENGVLDHQVEIVGEDTGCDVVKGQEAAQRLTADPTIVGIIGTNCSEVAAAIMPIVDSAGLVMLSPSNTSPGLTTTNPDWQGAFVRTAPNSLLQARVAAAFAYRELGARMAIILHDGSENNSSLAQAFAAAWRESGGTILAEMELAVGQTDLQDVIDFLAASRPDVLYLPLFEPEGNLVVNTIYEFPDLNELVLVGTDYLLLPSFPQSAGQAAEGMYLTGTAVASADYDNFLAKWDVKYGSPPPAPFHAHAYDAANILLNAVESAAQESSSGVLLIGRSALRQAVINTTEFAGLTGTLTCDAAGDCASGEALGAYRITEDEIAGNQWPPPLVWMP